MEISGKVAVVTGASQGIGLATAKLLAEKGAKVVLAARSRDLLEKLEKEIPNSFAMVMDMRNHEHIKSLIDKTIEKFGRVDILINNAGQGMYGPVEKINLEEYRQIMELNVFSVLKAMQEVIPHMKKQGKGIIVNVSSMLSKMYIPGISAYSSTKYALNAISFIARKELKESNIIVSVVRPKMTATNFSRNSFGGSPQFSNDSSGLSIDSPEKVADKIATIIQSEESEIDL
jgi:short-subunit dehydrogenase